MTAATLTAAMPADVVELQHQPWCREHWSEDAVCWAEDIDVRIQPETGDPHRGQLNLVMTHGARADGEPVNITVFADMVRDGESSVEFTPDEAEIAAHALLAMVSLSRGETSAADWHRTTAEQMAAALLARREAGAR